MKVNSCVWILVLSLAWGLSCDQQAFAQKRKPGSKAKDNDSDPQSRPDEPMDADDPDALFPAAESPESPLENIVRKAQDAYHAGRYEECIDLTTQVLETNPRHSVARYHRASALIDLGRRDKAIEKVRAGIADAREALSVAGKQFLIFHIPYFYGLTSLSEMERRPAHAELVLKVATPLMMRPDLPKNVRGLVYFQRGLAKVYLNDFRGAAADYGEALKIDPQLQAAHFNRADAFVKAGEPGKARETYDQAVRLMADDPLVYNNRGTFQLQQGRIDAAISDFNKALELDGTFAMAALNRGFAHAQQREWFEAENDYQLALEQDPNLVMAFKLLGAARLAQGKMKPAIEVLSKVLEFEPKNADNYAGRGYVEFFDQDYSAAVADFSQARKLNPTATLYAPWQYWAQVRGGQGEAAKQQLEAFVKAQPNTPNWHVTMCRYILGEVDEAGLLKVANSTNVAATKAQWLCEAHYCMGVQSEAANNPDAARQHFEECVKTNQSQLTAYMGAKLALSVK